MSIRTDIIDALRSPFCQRINFHIGSIRIQGTDYTTIATHIQNQTIQVVQSSVAPSTVAAYNKMYNCFITGTSPRRSLIIHEATHAINDSYRLNIADVEDEASAYIAEMIFRFAEDPLLRWNMQQPRVVRNEAAALQQCGIDPSACYAAVIGAASAIADDVLARGRIEDATLQPLRQALILDPNTHTGSPMRSYDGIARVAIPTSYLQSIQGNIIVQ